MAGGATSSLGLYGDPAVFVMHSIPKIWNPEKTPNPMTQALSHDWESHGDLITRLIMGTTTVTIWGIGVINLLTKSL